MRNTYHVRVTLGSSGKDVLVEYEEVTTVVIDILDDRTRRSLDNYQWADGLLLKDVIMRLYVNEGEIKLRKPI